MASPRDARDDFTLLDAWGDGDTAAANGLLQRYTGPLVGFFERKLEGPVEDLVQETLIRSIRVRGNFRREAGFRSFLFGIARNVFYEELRRRHRAPDQVDLESTPLADLAPTPSHVVEHKRERRILLDALRRLPVDTQMLLELYHWERLSGSELAAALGIGQPTLRSRLRRAMQALRKAVAEVAESEELLASSWADFEAWAQSLPRAEKST